MNEIKSNLYQIVKKYQGPKHPQFNYSSLEKCADDLVDQLKELGLTVNDQTFFVSGDSKPYRNIIASWGNIKPNALLIGSHYDTVPFSPGANDNLSAVAVSIELARLLSKEDQKPNVCFAFFTLEEGHPGYFAHKYNQLLESGIIDANNNFTDVGIFDLSIALSRFLDQDDTKKKTLELIDDFIAQGDFSEKESLYLSIFRESYHTFSSTSPTGKASYTLGSHHFAEEMHDLIGHVIVMDCLGWVGSERKVMDLIPLKGLEQFVTTYNANPYEQKGNFLTFMGDSASQSWLDAFQKHCTAPGFDFPHVSIKLPIPYEKIKEMAPDTLRSDHAPFWRKGVPAIFVSDTANFRSDYYHTPADTLDWINFTFLADFVKSLFHFVKQYR